MDVITKSVCVCFVCVSIISGTVLCINFVQAICPVRKVPLRMDVTQVEMHIKKLGMRRKRMTKREGRREGRKDESGKEWGKGGSRKDWRKDGSGKEWRKGGSGKEWRKKGRKVGKKEWRGKEAQRVAFVNISIPQRKLQRAREGGMTDGRKELIVRVLSFTRDTVLVLLWSALCVFSPVWKKGVCCSSKYHDRFLLWWLLLQLLRLVLSYMYKWF